MHAQLALLSATHVVLAMLEHTQFLVHPWLNHFIARTMLSTKTVCDISYSHTRTVDRATLGGAGGLEAQVTTNDQKKWDGKGSPPGAVGKTGTPLPSTLLTD